MFRIEYALHIKHDSKRYLFLKEGKIPFAPFVGLDILDDAIAEFQLEHVAWEPKSKIFLCQSSKRLPHLSVRQFCARLKAAGWVRDKSDDEVWARQSQPAEV
jgi:hypothetical protein